VWRSSSLGVHLAEIRSITVDPEVKAAAAAALSGSSGASGKTQSHLRLPVHPIPEFSLASDSPSQPSGLPDKIHKDCFNAHGFIAATRCHDSRRAATFAILPPPKNWLKIQA